jgi:hypothetical protein
MRYSTPQTIVFTAKDTSTLQAEQALYSTCRKRQRPLSRTRRISSPIPRTRMSPLRLKSRTGSPRGKRGLRSKCGRCSTRCILKVRSGATPLPWRCRNAYLVVIDRQKIAQIGKRCRPWSGGTSRYVIVVVGGLGHGVAESKNIAVSHARTGT